MPKMCGARELEKSHAGGNDYSAPCVKIVNDKGTHKGDHRTAAGHTWAPSKFDRRS